MKKIYIILLLLSICAALAGVWGTNKINSILDPEYIAKATEAKTGSALRLRERPSWRLFPPKIEFGQMDWTIARDDLKWKIKILKGFVAIDFLDLLWGNLKFSEINIDQPRITLERIAAAEKSSDEQNSAGDFPAEQIDRLVLSGGEFIWQNQEQELKITNINLVAENVANRQWSQIKCDFSLQEMERSSDNLDGNLAFKGQIRYYAPNLSFRDVSISFTPALQTIRLPTLSLVLAGAINLNDASYRVGSAKLASSLINIESSGEGKLSPLQFAGTVRITNAEPDEKPEPEASLLIDGNADYNSQKLVLKDLLIKYGNSSGTGTISCAFPQPNIDSAIDANFNFELLDLNNMPDFNMPDLNQNSQTPATKQFPAVNIAFRASQLKWQNCNLNNLKLLLTGKNGSYETRELEFDWAQGKVSGNLNGNLQAQRINIQAKGQNMNLGNALRQFNIAGVNGGKADCSVSISARGNTVTKMLSTLDGQAYLEANGASIHFLTEIAHMLPIPGGRNFVFPDTVNMLTASATANNGQLSIKPVKMEAGSVSAHGEAVLDLQKAWLSGAVTFGLLGLNLPVDFAGPLDNVSWHTGAGFFEQLRKLIP